MEYTGSRMIKATGTTIANILADIRRLPEWNPAILSVPTDDSTAIAQKEYSIDCSAAQNTESSAPCPRIRAHRTELGG